MPDYRMVSLSDIRMTPVTHTGVTYDYSGDRGVGGRTYSEAIPS